MTSPYSTNLLQQPVPASRTAAHPAPARVPAPTRSVTHVVAAPQPAPPQVVYVPVAPPGSRIAPVALALVVLLVGVIAAIGGYVASREAAPDPAEAALQRGIAAREGFVAGNARGRTLGRQAGFEVASVTAGLRARLAKQRAWDAAYRRGERAGARAYRRPSYGYSGGGGYRAPRYSYPRVSETYAAAGVAQSIANATGAPVDIEVY